MKAAQCLLPASPPPRLPRVCRDQRLRVIGVESEEAMVYPRRQDAVVSPDDCFSHPVIGWSAVRFGIATLRTCSVAILLLNRAGTGATGWNMAPRMHLGATLMFTGAAIGWERSPRQPGVLDISPSSPACMTIGGWLVLIAPKRIVHDYQMPSPPEGRLPYLESDNPNSELCLVGKNKKSSVPPSL